MEYKNDQDAYKGRNGTVSAGRQGRIAAENQLTSFESSNSVRTNTFPQNKPTH